MPILDSDEVDKSKKPLHMRISLWGIFMKIFLWSYARESKLHNLYVFAFMLILVITSLKIMAISNIYNCWKDISNGYISRAISAL